MTIRGQSKCKRATFFVLFLETHPSVPSWRSLGNQKKKPQTTKSHLYRLQFDSESVSALVKSLRPIRSYYTPARSQLRGLQMYRGPART